jgi:hypothetical protein
VFQADLSVNRVTYLDADLWFRKNPVEIFDEFESSGKAVLITDHAYSAEYDQSSSAGRFCVQFMIFERLGGELVRRWWEDRCLEWCFARHEDGKFGDQKYLDDWPIRFKEYVHVLANKELMLAPWNANRFPYGNSVIWHFHSLRICSESGDKFQVIVGEYDLPKNTYSNVYEPYILELQNITRNLLSSGFDVKRQALARKRFKFFQIFKSLGRVLRQAFI